MQTSTPCRVPAAESPEAYGAVLRDGGSDAPVREPGLCGRLAFVPPRSRVEEPPAPHPARVRTSEIQAAAVEAAPSVDDEALARAGMLGQPWAQREMWYRFAPMVFAFLRRSLGARHDHEDLLQEVFLRVFRRLDTLANPQALRSFVYSFAIRVVHEELRRHRIRGRLAALFPETFGVSSVPHVDFEARELLRRVEGALDRLPDRQRAVFVLRRLDGMELAEIAVSLDLSLATVKRDLEKANQHIARSIHRDERLRDGLEAGWLGRASGRTEEGDR